MELYNENLNIKNDLEKLKDIPRDKYQKVFEILSDNIWEYGGGILFEDLKSGAISMEIKDNNLIDKLDSEEDIVKLLTKNDLDYSSKESEDFIMKVKASNIKEISESGYFYKKLASSMGSVKIVSEDCGSKGKIYSTKEILNKENIKEFFEYKIRNLYIIERDKCFSKLDDFINSISNIDEFHVRTPIECEYASERNFCNKCCGLMDTGGNEIRSKNIGIVATLAITENVTQGALNTMNNGMEENVNVTLEKKFPISSGSFEDHKNIIYSLVDDMSGVGVQARWYEIALVGRVFKRAIRNDEPVYSSTSFKSSSNFSVDPMSRFLFSQRVQNLKSLLQGIESSTGENVFEINSCKAENLFGIY